MDIYLIRHGECYHSTTEYYDHAKKTINPPLTEKGIGQAEKLAMRCSTIGFDRIITSDLIRAMQTAERMTAIAPCETTITSDFREIDMGDVHTKTWDAFPDIHAQWVLHKEDIPYPSGENGEDVWKRCKKQLEALAASQAERVAIVCHGGTIRSIICGVLEIPQQKRFYLGAPVENCSISMLRYSAMDKRFCLHMFNDFSHLEG